jgi:undecaprenyl-diphosphatase
MEYLQHIDRLLLSFFSEGIKNSFFDVLMPFVSLLNNHGEVWIALAIVLMISKDTRIRRLGVSVLIGLALTEILGNQMIKNFIARPRPIGDEFSFDFIIKLPESYSFPSGHTSTSFAVAGAFLFSKARYKYWVLILASLIAFSRIYLHVHYPSDIIGGILLGLICGKLAEILSKGFFRKKQSS